MTSPRTRLAVLDALGPVPLAILGILGVAIVVGYAIPSFVDAMGEGTAKLVALPAALFFALMLVWSRRNLLLLIIVTRASCDLPFDSTRFSIGGAQIGVGGLVNAVVIGVAALLVLEKPHWLTRALVRTWLPFLVVALIGVAIAPDRGGAARVYLTFLSTFAVLVGAFYVVRSPEDFRTCVKLVLLSSLVPVVYGLVEFATTGGINYADAGPRIRSTFGHPNIFAFYLVLVISLVLYMMKSGGFAHTLPRQAALGLYLLVLLALLALTKTRSAWIACFALFAVYGLFFERRYLLYLLVASAGALFLPGVGDRVLEIVQDQPVLSSWTALNSWDWRVSLWQSAIDWMTPGHYALGYGLEAFGFYVPTFFPQSNNIAFGAHNVYVQLLFDLGLVGVAAFLWMYGQALAQLKPLFGKDRLAAFLLVILVVEYLVVAASDNMLHYLSFNWYLWFMCGAGMSLAVARPDEAAVVEKRW